MICAGGGQLGKIPNTGGLISCIPVDTDSAYVVDIVLQDYNINNNVHHLLNPNVISWNEFLVNLKQAGLQFEIVPIKEFFDNILTGKHNPLLKLASFFEKYYLNGQSNKLAQYETQKIVEKTNNFKLCPAIDQHLIELYLNYWYKSKFLKYGYKSKE
ncbi:unnamed protein product [Didymodactylos carnosus]|uniref:Uncharacterized protein n=1 Tax=Didymodactylos carnosus TaxID=1234261 RepID=A0A813TFX2_9BILA|nr:unnamed protein product [Didymodactylos carnosus]CAF0889410.1 unnamed protein product [Didymodactylos carnosus]CAF3595945.1 unnamed protein product [Didymodactylos carnosus]CAF3671861.1 unnamed protein product [Didymodactylos carnosus]